jgi:hypothetical protein
MIKGSRDIDIPTNLDTNGVLGRMDQGTMSSGSQSFATVMFQGKITQKDTTALKSGSLFASEVSTNQDRS